MRTGAARRSLAVLAALIALLAVAGCAGAGSPTADNLTEQGWKNVSVSTVQESGVKTVVVSGEPPYKGADLSDAAVAAWTHEAGPHDLVEVKTSSTTRYYNSGDRKDLMGDAAGPSVSQSFSGGGAFGWWNSISRWVLLAAVAVIMYGLIRAFRSRVVSRNRSGELAPLAPDPDEAKEALEGVGTRVAKTGLAAVPAEVAAAANAPDGGAEPAAPDAPKGARSSEATAQDVLDVLELMLTSEIDPVWLMGGWAADAAAGRQRRRQTVIEVAVGADRFPVAVERFADVGFSSIETATTPHGQVELLADRNGLRVRLMTLTPDPERPDDVVVLVDGQRVDRASVVVGSVQGVPVKCVPPGGARPGGRKSRRDQKLADRRAAGRGNRRGRFSEPEPEPEAKAEPAPEVAAEAKPYDQAEVSQPGADAPQPADVTSD